MNLEKEQRQERILLSLKKHDFLSRSQLQAMHRLGKVRNTNRVLKEMSEYLSSFRHGNGEHIYYLNKEGRERVNSKKVVKKTQQINHYLMRNSLFIAFHYPATWRNEIKIGVKEKNISVIADAIFEKDKRLHIVEVDFSQKMKENREKIARYKEFLSMDLFPTAPKFVWITTTAHRKKQIEELSQGMDVQVFLATDFN